MRASILMFGLCGLMGCASAPDEPAPNPDFARALAPVFAVDMPEALARMAALEPASLNASQRHTRDCMIDRFGTAAAAQSSDSALAAPVEAVLLAYRRYWTTALMQRASPERAEAQLSADLGNLLGITGTGIDAQAEEAVRVAERNGLHALGGITAPLQEFMLWRQQTTRRETIALVGGSVDIQVTMLDGFVSLGWAGWGTCERSHTGGWATTDGIMVVAPAWRLDSEEYLVSLRAHEAQHFSDYRIYPKLAAPDLEYRAKLVELALADQTQRALLDQFTANAKRDRTLPHSFANYWVVEHLRARLGVASWNAGTTLSVRTAATAELAAHSAALDARGRDSVETALPD
jgi:hypothetical protein